MKLCYMLKGCGKCLMVVLIIVFIMSLFRDRKKLSNLVKIDKSPANIYSPTSRANPNVFSVIAVNVSSNSQWDIYAVNMWIEADEYTSVVCCYLLNEGTVVWRKYLRVNHRVNMFNHTAQVECPNPLLDLQHYYIVGITVTNSCPENSKHYTIPQYPIQPKSHFKFALCSKIVYGEVDIEFTIEWMEYNRHMGVEKVLLYTYNISSGVRSILQHYEDTGFLTLIPYYLPFEDDEAHKIGSKTTEAWNDEQVVVYDCQLRLRSYDYVGIIDLDEFIVPVMDRSFEIMLRRLLHLLPNMAATEVYGEIFVLDWQKTNPSDALVVTQYRHRTESYKPVDINQRKLIHIPSRIERGSVVTHGLKTLNDSYLIFKDPLSVMVINHYRKCVAFRDDCHSRKKVYDERIVRHLTRKVRKAIEEAKIFFTTIIDKKD